MNKTKFYITDVFAFKKYSGNQLATFVDCEHFSQEEMQKIAREINFAETTFITSRDKQNGGYNVKIFTPFHEVDFAGHPTLGTSFIINKYIENSKSKQIKLNLKAGQIPVTVKGNEYWMLQKQPVFYNKYNESEVCEAINLQLKDFNNIFPIQEVSTGLPFIMAPLKNMSALKKAKINDFHYQNFINKSNAKAIMIFCPEGYQLNHAISTRMFAPYYGVHEDPATGSATGCLAAYFLKYNFFNKNNIDIKVGQGFEIGRPSELLIKASLANDRYNLNIGGRVIEIAEGIWK